MVSKGKEIKSEEFEKILSECEAKMSGLSEDDWQDIIDRHGLDINRDTLRKNCTGIFGSVFVKQYYEEKNAKDKYSDDEYIQKLGADYSKKLVAMQAIAVAEDLAVTDEDLKEQI